MPTTDQFVVGSIVTDPSGSVSVPLYVLTSDTTVGLNVTVVANSADTLLNATWNMLGLAKKTDGQDAELIGNTVLISSVKDPGVVGWDVSLQASGSAVMVTLTGDGAQIVDWTLSCLAVSP